MYGFQDKRKAVVLSEYAARLLHNPAQYDTQAPIINPPVLVNDLRYRRYNAVAEVREVIHRAVWDPVESMYRAGSGLVRIYQRYNPLDNQDVVDDPATRIGPWNYDVNDGSSVTTKFRDVLCYNIDPCTEYIPLRGDGTPNLIYIFEDINGDLWVHERPEIRDNVVPATASTCIYPGDGGAIEPYTYSDGQWIPSGMTCQLYDTSCYIMAVPGEIFWVHLNQEQCKDNGLCTANSISPHGNIRRVRMYSGISCGDSGQATILQSEGGCIGSPTQCKINVCNMSNRPIKCSDTIDYEDGTAFLQQDKCTWSVIPDQRATIARVTIEDNMCGGAPVIKADSEQFIDVCEWNEKIAAAENPFRRYGCKDTEIELSWNAAICKWYVSDVPRIESKLLTEIIPCTDCLSIKGKQYEKAAIETCTCNKQDKDLIPLETRAFIDTLWYTLEDDGSGTNKECTMHVTTQEVCAIACGAGGSNTGHYTMHKKSVLTHLSEETDGIYCHTINVFSPCDDGEAGQFKCINTTDCPPDTGQARLLLLDLLSTLSKEDLIDTLKEVLKGLQP